MIELLRKTVYATVGMVLVTRDVAEEMGKKIAQEAKMSESEGKKFIDELMKKTDQARVSLEKMINEKVELALKKINIPSREELKNIECRLSKLEKQEKN